MDAGIIKNFKLFYKKLQVKSLLEKLKEKKELEMPTVFEAIKFLKSAWGNVSSTTVINRWKHCGIINNCSNIVEIESLPSLTNEFNDWRTALQQFAYVNTLMTYAEYLDCDKEELTADLLTRQEITEFTDDVSQSNLEEELNDPEFLGVDLVEPKVINSTEAMSLANQLETYFQQHYSSDDQSMVLLTQLKLTIENFHQKSSSS